VDLALAQREHDAFVELLASLGPTVHLLPDESESPDLVYTFDPLLMADAGAIPLRPGKANRLGEPAVLERWTVAAGIPTAGRIEPPGTLEGGDTFWLRPDLLVVGRTLRTNDAGARQLAAIVGGESLVVDVPYWRGPAELIHLLSVISPVANDLAVVYLPLLPVGLWERLNDLGVRLLEVPDEEFGTLACNVLAVRPGVVIMAEGNPRTRRALEAAGCQVHTYAAAEIGINGSGGPTCLTRPVLRG
jgi:N-dimethylarginine dimethylaminohydrolase